MKRIPVLLAFLMAFVLATAPAFAHHKDGHDKGGKGKNAPQVTEDNDDNDGGTPNNVSDDGDNKHPSGKDKSVENGNSGNQGKSGSDPDGDSNGGADKPGGSGGIDKADQDGNNGCGNDDDFEDDNNGNCGGKGKGKGKDKVKSCSPGHTKNGKCGSEAPCEDDASMAAGTECHDSDDSDETCDSTMSSESDEDCAVEGGAVAAAGKGSASVGLLGDDVAASDADVLGSTLSRSGDGADSSVAGDDSVVAAGVSERAGILPFTGGTVLGFFVVALALVGAGMLLLKWRRGTRAEV